MSFEVRKARNSAARLFRRVDVRLTIWFSGIFLLSALLLFGITFAGLYRSLREEDRRGLQAIALGYVVQFRASINERAGVNSLVNELMSDMSSPAGDPYFARIATAENSRVFLGIPQRDWQQIDLSGLTETDAPHDEGFLTIEAPQFGYELEVLGVRLSEDYVLQVGSDTRSRIHVLRAFQTSFLFTFAVMLGVSLGGGLFFAARSLRPIRVLNATVRSIIETGELDRRVPSRQSSDELDDMTESVNAMLDRIQALVEGLRDALDSVAHDLRTPLTRLRSTAERALSGPPDETAQREALSDALEESEHILGMLNAMMDISEAESGTMRLRREPVDLAQLASEVAEVYSLVAEEADMRFVLDTEDGLVVNADSGRMRQVIGNLLDNAVKYGEPGTPVRVVGRTVYRGGSGAGKPGRGGRGEVALSVINEGAPMSPDDLERIWNRLYRGVGAGDRRDGLGLGLALVRAIVHAHGGNVDVESSAEHGTTFTLRFPRGDSPR
ncbi:MAG: ATP-binding protein [Spirochaetota bacterium]